MVDKIEVECPLPECRHVVHNSGALGTHLSGAHDIRDKGLRRFIVVKAREAVKNGGSPLKMSLEQFRDQYLEHVETVDDEPVQPAKPIAPSPKVITLVDNMETAEYIEDTMEGDVAVYRRRMPITVRPQSLTLSPEVYIFYDWVRQHGYSKSLSEFINDVVRSFFRERGIGIGVVRLEYE